ncbi:MAG: hypothetical protein ACPGVU_21155 [Limisphaerales bacterium]
MKHIITLLITVGAADGFFISVGGINTEKNGKKIEAEFGTIYTSPDGENWTERFKGGPVKDKFSHANNNMWRCLTYGNGRFVATGNPKAALTSTDGKHWEVVEAPSGAFSVEFGNGIFLAPNAYSFMISKDGKSWEKSKLKPGFKVWGGEGAGHVRKIVFGNGVFVCVGEQRIGVTKDGQSWLHHEIIPKDKRPGRSLILFGNARFVWATQKNGVLSSKDGITWDPVNLPDLAGKPKFGSSGVFDGDKFLISGAQWADKNKIIYGSKDGLSWTKFVENVHNTTFHTAGNGLLLQNNGWAKQFVISKDKGRTWKKIPADVAARKVYFFDGQRIIGQSGG